MLYEAVRNLENKKHDVTNIQPSIPLYVLHIESQYRVSTAAQ